MMKRLKFLLLLGGFILCVNSCKENKDVMTIHNFSAIQDTPELLDYFADSKVTRYSYYMEEGDTCQMALREKTIYISHARGKNGIVINVVVK